MKYKELINEYLITIYRFSSNTDGWCVHHKYYNIDIILQRLISDIERIFPNMDATEVVNDWWKLNVKTTEDRIDTHLCTCRLIVGNRGQAWEVVDRTGKPFDDKAILKLVGSHHNPNTIKKYYEEWFDEQKYEATKRVMGIK